MKKLPEKIDSKYRYVLLASQRAEEIVTGSATRAEAKSTRPTRVGMHEIATDAIEWDYGPAVEPEQDSLEEEGEAEPAEGVEK